MKSALKAVLLSFLVVGFAWASDKGFCPPIPASSSQLRVPVEPAPLPDKTYVGTVSLLTVVSDKGNFCDARVIRGLSKAIDKDALRQVHDWQFRASSKEGKPVPVIVQIDIQYWRDKDGKLVGLPSKEYDVINKVR